MATKKVKRYNGEDDSLTSSDASNDASNNADSIRAAQEEIYIPDSSIKTPAQPTQRRTPMVTKEQLDASGLSLRDYMNKQLGLKRRDGSAPAAKAPAPAAKAPAPVAKASAPATKTSNNEWDDNSTPVKDTAPAKNETQGSSIGDSDWAKSVRASQAAADQANEGVPLGKRIRAALGSKYAKGGSVSSASSRGDGIAQRGKTRGVMVMCGGGMAKGKK